MGLVVVRGVLYADAAHAIFFMVVTERSARFIVAMQSAICQSVEAMMLQENAAVFRTE